MTCASHLISTHTLEILTFKKYGCFYQSVKRPRRHDRCMMNHATDPIASFNEILFGRDVHAGMFLCLTFLVLSGYLFFLRSIERSDAFHLQARCVVWLCNNHPSWQ